MSYNMSGEPSNETLKAMIDDMQKRSDERHLDYKEERKEIKNMLQEINGSLKKLSDDHVNTEKNLALLLEWSVEAKKAIESNSAGVSALQKRDYMVMGGVAVVMAIGGFFLTLFIRDLKHSILEESSKQTYDTVNLVFDERVEKTLKTK